jgi:fructose-1,6-bisphosphatase
MSAIDVMKKELEDIELKLSSARKAAEAADAGEREKSDFKLIEQECLAMQQKVRRAEETGAKHEGTPGDTKKKLDKQLDDALKGTFPGSDPVAVAQPAPFREEDRELPAVKVAEQQAPKRTKAARKANSK